MNRFRQVCRLNNWDDETQNKKKAYLLKFAEKKLGRKINKSKIADDYEAMHLMDAELKKFKKFRAAMVSVV